MIQFLAANWPWIAVIVFFVILHRGGHGCGTHGTHGDHQRDGHHHEGRPAARAGDAQPLS